MPGHFVCELDMFSKQFPAGDRAVFLLFEPWQNKLSENKSCYLLDDPHTGMVAILFM